MRAIDWTVFPSPCTIDRQRKVFLEQSRDLLSENCAREAECDKNEETDHFVCENTIDTLLVEIREPLQSLELIVLERTSQKLRLLDFDISVHQARILEVELLGVDWLQTALI